MLRPSQPGWSLAIPGSTGTLERVAQSWRAWRAQARAVMQGMKPILHLVRFDTAAMKWPLVGWTALLLAEAVWFYIGPPSAPRAYYVSVIALPGIRALVTAILVAALVQRDAMAGPAAFWQARPISRIALLASRVTSALLWFVALPATLAFAVLSMLGLGAADALNGGWMVVQFQVAVVVSAMAAAAVTTSLLYFTLVMAGALTASVVIRTGVSNGIVRAWPTLKIPVVLDSWLTAWPFVMAAVFLAVVSHYLTLKVRRTWFILGLVAVAGSVVAGLQVGIGSAETPVIEGNQAASIGSSAFKLVADAATYHIEPPSPATVSGLPRLTFDFSWSGAGPGVTLSLGSIKALAEFPDGTRSEWSNGAVHSQRPDRGRSPSANAGSVTIASALGTPAVMADRGLLEFFSSSSSTTALLDVPEADFRKHHGETAKLSCGIQGWAYQVRIAASAPLREGARLAFDRGIATISRIRLNQDALAIDVRHVRADDPSDSTGLLGFPHRRLSVLRNRSRQQSLVLFPVASPAWSAMLFGPKAAQSRCFTEEFRQADASGSVFPIDAEWLAGAEFVRMELWPLGVVRLPIVIDNLVLVATR